MDNTTENKKLEHQAKVDKKPNEKAGFSFSSSIKITDPVTGKVLVQKRAD
jgi:hypothetical protein